MTRENQNTQRFPKKEVKKETKVRFQGVEKILERIQDHRLVKRKSLQRRRKH